MLLEEAIADFPQQKGIEEIQMNDYEARVLILLARRRTSLVESVCRIRQEGSRGGVDPDECGGFPACLNRSPRRGCPSKQRTCRLVPAQSGAHHDDQACSRLVEAASQGVPNKKEFPCRSILVGISEQFGHFRSLAFFL